MVIERFLTFSMTKEYFQLLWIRRIQLTRLDNFFEKFFLRKLVFLNLIFLTFLPIILLKAKISEPAVPYFLRINVSKLMMKFCIDNSKNKSVVAPRSSPIFFLTYFSNAKIDQTIEFLWHARSWGQKQV